MDDCYASAYWIKAHCLCSTGELFSMDFAFDSSEAYCCGDGCSLVPKGTVQQCRLLYSAFLSWICSD